MRDFLNGIFSFIGASSLTDEEFATVQAEHPVVDQATYDDLARILDSREAISTLQERLVAYYGAKGVDVVSLDTAKSQIYLGNVL